MSGQTVCQRVVVVGAGIGGLATAALLARSGRQVTIVDAADEAGGKLRQVSDGTRRFDAGPTVLTMRWVFDELYARLGTSVDEHLAMTPASVLARHHWPDGSSLDLHAKPEASADAIAAFAGPAEAQRFLRFCRRAGAIYEVLEQAFLHSQRPPTPLHLAARVGLRRLPALARISPFSTLWGELGGHFRDERLRQLFGRYATYCGSSPFSAPATLMLVAHVEQRGVWLVRGGMVRLAESVASLAKQHGATLRLGCAVREIVERDGRCTGVTLEDGEFLPAAAVVFNGDRAALDEGLLGAGGSRPAGRGERSLSAVTWNLAADLRGRPLHRHTVFFGDDCRREFEDLFRRHELPSAPTVYACAQDRDAQGAGPCGPERLLLLANAPAGWVQQPGALERLQDAVEATVRRHGIDATLSGPAVVRRTPSDFARLYPGTGGALYGAASHGWRASFRRPGARTRVRGLYCAGGSAHPGPGVPMAVLSARLAVAALLEDEAR